MKEIIEDFYEKRIKKYEELLNHELKRGKSRYFYYAFSYIFLIFIICFGIFNLYNTPISGIIVPFFIILGVIFTIILIYGIGKLYLKTSSKIPVKERILKRLNLAENSSIDKLNIYAAGGLYFVSIIIAIILYYYSFSSSNPSLMLIISSVIMFLIVFLIYRAFLVYKTKLTKEYFIIKKPIIFHKFHIKWSDINSIKSLVKDRRDEHGADLYTIHRLMLNTNLLKRPFKIYLGRNRSLAAMKVLEEFFEYMREL